MAISVRETETVATRGRNNKKKREEKRDHKIGLECSPRGLDGSQRGVKRLSSTESQALGSKKPRRGRENYGVTLESPSLPLGIETQWCSTAFFNHLTSDL